MKILMVHNYYRERGGECAVFDAECALLRDAGHRVVTYTRHSDETVGEGALRRLTLPLRTVWASDSQWELAALIGREAPDVAHFANTFPLISPAAYPACDRAGVPIVQTLHNYRWLCPAATLFRNGRVCEECIDHSLLRGVVHGCYRESSAATAVVATMIAASRRRTLIALVDRFVALTEFARARFAAGGFPAERIAVKPNFAELDAGPPHPDGERRTALFVGRLSPEKGLDVLLDAWKRLAAPPPLRIAGDGPLRAALERRIDVEGIHGVELLGRLDRAPLVEELRRARALVVPSLWYEGMPMAIVEAFACGVPVIASRLGGMAEMIDDGRTGLLFGAGDPAELAAAIGSRWGDDGLWSGMSAAARAEYDARYRAGPNLERLLAIYREAIDARRARA